MNRLLKQHEVKPECKNKQLLLKFSRNKNTTSVNKTSFWLKNSKNISPCLTKNYNTDNYFCVLKTTHILP
jgi:hypothetical protein